MGISFSFLWTTKLFSVDISYFVLFAEIFMSIWFQDKNWGVLEVNHLKGRRKTDNLCEKRTKPTLDQQTEIVHNFRVGSQLKVKRAYKAQAE